MQAKEFRIGNYILFNNFIQRERLVIVDGKFLLPFNKTNSEINNYYQPIPLTEEWLLKFGFENWGYGSLYSNENEKYTRYVLHNILDGTSNFEIHFIESNYGNILHTEYVISCDEDDRINWGVELKYIHQLQNLYFALTGEELTLNN